MSGLHETDADEPVGVSRLDGGGDRVVVGDLGGVGGAIGGETPDAPQRPEERFLAGRVIARQPATGYRAALDTVLLGAAVGLRPGEAGLELGCGSGAALLIAAERSPGAAPEPQPSSSPASPGRRPTAAPKSTVSSAAR